METPSYKILKQRYESLEEEVVWSLQSEIENSDKESEHCNTKVIDTKIHDYPELAVINDRLTFIDRDGQHYGIYAVSTLEDLINILTAIA